MNALETFASLLPLAILYLYGLGSRLLEARRPSLSQLIDQQRRHWVAQAARRETPLDGILAGNIMNAVSFFASTTALLIIALFTVIGQLPQFIPALDAFTLGTRHTDRGFQLHNVAMLVLFVSSFLSFTLSLRQFNHFCILIGGTDHVRGATPEEIRTIARINALAAQNFNAGIRAYYYAIPMLAWFVSDWLSVIVALTTTVVLIHREFFSEARWLIARITPH